MSDFEKWFRGLNANGKTVYFLGNEHKVSEMAWNHQQATIDNLKTQLNNMEACYIQVKKEVEDQQKRIDAVKAIMNEYYTGSFDESAEMAGLISLALRGASD